MRLPKSTAVYATAAATFTLLGGAATTYGATFKTVTVQDSGQRRTLCGFSTGTVGQFLKRYGIQVKSRDHVSPSIDSPVQNHMVVNIEHPKAITINDNGKLETVSTFDNSVGELLKDQGISLTSSDHVSVPNSSSLSDGEVISIHSTTEKVSTKTQDIPFQTIRRRSAQLLSGHEKVVAHGVKGSLQLQTTSVYRDGHKISETVTKKVVHQPVNQIVEVGTATAVHHYTLASRSGSPGSGMVQSSMTVLATAYAAGGVTATGRPAQPGVIAVDPNVIPLGSKVYIPGLGTYTAADTGGAIVGHHIDICMGSASAASQWGERTVTVYIVK
ncbi:3D domain-containing protein [Alicyclobacillus dauci]|uniref:Ubiquitin-like domain-containing protein n=1 Tax=Alicyclobacillus dauci TaxID=1475485 RepID=A0ABY6Z7V1_9BACL|nr:3D domain-containing protein [Alicyclobacillus dauci]WAH38959.1 ubiquitin-like domain-containing protein [Alicyclobacillus dauci]